MLKAQDFSWVGWQKGGNLDGPGMRDVIEHFKQGIGDVDSQEVRGVRGRSAWLEIRQPNAVQQDRLRLQPASFFLGQRAIKIVREPLSYRLGGSAEAESAGSAYKASANIFHGKDCLFLGIIISMAARPSP